MSTIVLGRESTVSIDDGRGGGGGGDARALGLTSQLTG